MRRADVALAVALLAIVGMMIVPLPTHLLDMLIVSNIAVSVLVLLIAVRMRDALAFTAMPTLLLVTTLYRLALNVSSTRLILLQADAGEVIRSFGEFVVRGDYVVGGVVFLVLTLIQYVVVARGAERVAEVGARFTLDAMPGKQMSIDADLRAGVIHAQEARGLRARLERESHLYGAMDGAMKFVKGDAIAGIVITLVNIVAGVGIGAGMRGLALPDALRVYGLLTVGDGLVSQIPSLLTATGAGIIVTRVASREDGASLGGDIGAQLFGDPRVLAIGAGFLAVLAVVPGLPALPFAFLAVLLGASAYVTWHSAATRATGAGATHAATQHGAAEVAAVGVDLGTELHAAIVSSRGPGALDHALGDLRARIAADLGVPVPDVRVSTNAALGPRAFALRLAEIPLARGDAPTALAAPEAAALVARELETLVRRHAPDLVGLDQAQRMLDRLETTDPALVRAVVPDPVPLRVLVDVLRRLLAEGVSIRPLKQILEALAHDAGATRDPGVLVERVRTALARHITFAHARDGVVAVHPLDPMVEDAIRDAIHEAPEGEYLAMAPDETRDLVAATRALSNGGVHGAVLVTQPDVRRFVRQILRDDLPDLAVLAYPELAPEARVDRLAPLVLGRRHAAE